MKKDNFIPYGYGHTKKYNKSVVADFLVEKCSDTNEVKMNSDICLLLRQKNIHNTIGADILRNYVQSLEVNHTPTPDFTDKELFRLIEPKDINNLTTAYEYSKYIQEHEDQLKAKHKEICKQKQQYDEYIKKYHST